MNIQKVMKFFTGDRPSDLTHWRHQLPDGVLAEMDSIIGGTKKYKASYKHALHIREAQLLLALTEMSMRLRAIEERLGMAEVQQTENTTAEQQETGEAE